MLTVRQTDAYRRWFTNLKDTRAKARIDVRIRRLALGNAGDVKPVGRVYYKQYDSVVVILLVGGDKSTQSKDIEKAIELANNL